METKTLLTIVALMLAGFITIMVARGDDDKANNVLNEGSKVWQTNDAVHSPAASASARAKISYNKAEPLHPQATVN